MMQDNQINKLYRDTSYFEPSKFKMFVDDLSNLVISINSKAIQQLFLQCSGYGYFQEGQKKIQTELKQNYISYLKQALDQCSCLKILKIQFNGFSIQDGSFLKIISLIQDIIKEQNRDIQILWIHTRLLRDCDVQMLGKLLNLSDYLIARNKIQQLSLQISGWQFKTGPLSNKQFLDLFGGFANNIMLMGQHNIKRFKLNISSLYMHELQAYNFLKQTIPQRNLIQSIENKRLQQRNNDQKKKSALREDRLNQHRQEIRRYLHLIDDKYAIEHPIPGKTKYISREPQFQKRKKEYIYQMLQANVRKMDLMKVLNEQMGMFEEHKQALKQIRKEVDQDMEEQAKRIREDQILIQQTSQIERRVADKFIKFPFDFVMAQRVQRFRQQIKDFVELLIERLSKMQELELDMRNWNDIFQMGELKKVLTIEFASGGIKPLLNKGSKIAQKKVFNQPEEESSKLKCTFIM